MEQAFDLGEVLPETLNAASEDVAARGDLRACTSVTRQGRSVPGSQLQSGQNRPMIDKTTRAPLP